MTTAKTARTPRNDCSFAIDLAIQCNLRVYTASHPSHRQQNVGVLEVLSKEIDDLVKGLGYSDEVAEDVVNMVSSWKDERARPVLIGWKIRVAGAKEDYKRGRISKEQFARIEWSVIEEVSQRIKKEIAYNEGIFDLANAVKHEQADYLGYSQLLYLLCNYAGL